MCSRGPSERVGDRGHRDESAGWRADRAELGDRRWAFAPGVVLLERCGPVVDELRRGGCASTSATWATRPSGRSLWLVPSSIRAIIEECTPSGVATACWDRPRSKRRRRIRRRAERGAQRSSSLAPQGGDGAGALSVVGDEVALASRSSRRASRCRSVLASSGCQAISASNSPSSASGVKCTQLLTTDASLRGGPVPWPMANHAGHSWHECLQPPYRRTSPRS